MHTLPPHDPAFPKQWADEMALASSTLSTPPPSLLPPPKSPAHPQSQSQSLAAPAFDSQLDAFLHRFQHHILAARDLKHRLDHFQSHDDPAYHAYKHSFKMKMHHIRSLFATEGEHFVNTLERRNPHLTVPECGHNTLELANGIERLESAVRHEESRRAAAAAAAAVGAADAAPTERELPPPPPPHAPSSSLQASPQRASPAPLSPRLSPSAVGHSRKLSSEETLQLMQSDIQALKLELMRLHRAKAGAALGALPPLHTHAHAPSAHHDTTPCTSSTVSPEAKSAPPPPPSASAAAAAAAAAAPIPASILANERVSIVRVTGRATAAPNYVSHLEQMRTRLQALENKPLSRRAKSAARLGRTQTMSSMYEAQGRGGDENANPNVAAMVTPPRVSRRQHRSVSTTSPPRAFGAAPLATPPPQPPAPPAALSPLLPQPAALAALEALRGECSPRTTPSPVRLGRERASGSPARLYFDAPEDMLARPQSHAAACDMQRYSLKVSRRFGAAEAVGAGGSGDGGGGGNEPRAKSAVTVSPSRRRGAMAQGGKSVGNALAEGAAGAGGAVALGAAAAAAAGRAAPSTVDTVGSAGGRVVEEIEGDMWVRKGVLWKRWRRRYASIVSHAFFGKAICLFSYDGGGGVMSTRSQIVVLGNSLCKAVREKLEIGGQERFMFVLRTSSKEYFFAAETDEIRRNWIRELKEAARKDAGRLPHATTKGRSMALRKRG